MDLIFVAIFFALGAIIGSFLNVVIYRLNTGRGLWGRSFCNSCSRTLEWVDLVPIFSFLILRARCRRCSSKISSQYVFVEVLTGVVFVLIYLSLAHLLFTPFIFVFYYLLLLSIFSTLIVILMYDFKHTIIPDICVFVFIGLSLLYLLVSNQWEPSWVDLLAGPALFLPFWALWYFSKGTWMGFGDAKLAWGIGWFLGLMKGITAIVFAFWIGAVVALPILLITRLRGTDSGLTMKSEVPFAPFLIIATALVFFLDINILGILIR